MVVFYCVGLGYASLRYPPFLLERAQLNIKMIL